MRGTEAVVTWSLSTGGVCVPRTGTWSSEEDRRQLYLQFGGVETTVEPGAVRCDYRLPGATRRVREGTDFLVDLRVQVGASYSTLPG